MRIKITDRIEYIAASENPLSADVVFVKGNDSIWIFDVGESDEAYEAIAELLKDNQVNIILSHFHRDHMWNLERIAAIPTVDRCVNLYVSKHTYKYAKTGIIVEDDVVIDDGVKIHIFPISATHSKGCLCLEVDDEITFLGDAIYPAYKGRGEGDEYIILENRRKYQKQGKAYNVQLLREQIETLKSLKSDQLFMAHEVRPIVKRKIIIRFLESIYDKREPGEPFIFQ